MKQPVRLVIKYLRIIMLVAAVAVFIRLLSSLDTKELANVVDEMSLGWIAAALGCILLNFLFAAKRYQALVAGNLPFFKVFEIIMASFLLNYASMVQGLGLGAKIGMMKADGVEASRSVAGVITEIVFDLGFAVGMWLLFLAVADGPFDIFEGIQNQGAMLFGALVLLSLVVIAGLMFRPFLRDISRNLKLIAGSRGLITALLATGGIWIVAGLGFYCMLHSLASGGSASLFLCIFAITTGFITGLVSMIPGGIGIREITWAYVVSLSGVSIGMAGLIALLYRILSIVVILLVLVMWRQMLRLVTRPT